jgi:threonylcarbamoyladenosine tRNA methylthiotransferase MtaB
VAGSSDGAPPPIGGPARRGERVALVALGCRVSRADLDALASALGEGFAVAADGEPADFVVVNTCSITSDAESAARQAIRRAAREQPGARIVAAGCYAEVCPDALASLPGVAAVVGSRAQAAIPGLLARLRDGERGPEAVARSAAAAGAWTEAPLGPARHTRPFLKVQDGCDQRCSYCIVPRARGPSRSLPFEEALRRLAALGERHAEVVLTGVHLGAYGRDLSPARSLAALVHEGARRGLVRRLRLSSIEPRELPRSLLLEREATSAVCEHFHLPLQSGSASVLRAMGRPHGADEFRAAVEELSGLAPGVCLGTDVMAGFPGETEADHRATVALVESLPLAYLHVFPFSPRPGTVAEAMEGRVPGALVRDRVRELRAISARKWRAFLGAQTGRDLEALVERVDGGLARGTARQYVTVRWPWSGERRGELARVRIAGSDGTECLGVGARAPGARLQP